jgi:hypothetical protein
MNTEFLDDINWIAVLVGALGYFMLGAIWYSPVGFGKKWIRYTGIDPTNPEVKKGAGGIMLGSLLLMFIASSGLAILINRMDILGGWISGVKLGLLTGITIAATAISISLIYEKRPLGLHLIDGLYNVLGNVIAAVIICVWR